MIMPVRTPHKIPEGFPNERLTLLPGRTLQAIADHPLARRLHPTRIGFFPEATGHFIERSEGLDENVFLLCLKGAGWVECTGGQRARIVAPAYVWLPAGSPHRYAADPNEPWTLAWLHIVGTEAATHLSLAGLPATTHPIQRSELARDRFERIYALCLSSPSPAAQLCLHTELANWLAGLTHNSEAQISAEDPRRKKLDRLLRHLRENLHRPISVSEMARLVAWTPNHLNSVFQDTLKDSPAAYFQQLKMTRACELLRGSEQSITEIAEALGFNDAFYFSRSFRRCYKLSPREYRKTRS